MLDHHSPAQWGKRCAMFCRMTEGFPVHEAFDLGGDCLDAPAEIPSGSTERIVTDSGDVFSSTCTVFRGDWL